MKLDIYCVFLCVIEGNWIRAIGNAQPHIVYYPPLRSGKIDHIASF